MVDLAAADIARVVHGLSITPALANRVRALLSKMLSLAVVWGVRSDPANPARAVQKYPERSRARYLSGEEVKRLGDALSAAQRNASEPWQAIAANGRYLRPAVEDAKISSEFDTKSLIKFQAGLRFGE